MGFIKRAFRRILKFIAIFSSYLYTASVNKKISYFVNIFYSFWISREFKNVKKDTLWVLRPIYLKGGKYITIGEKFSTGKRLRLECWDSYMGIKYTPNITIGNNVNIGHDCHIGAINEIVIGDNVLIGSKVYISDHSHGNTTILDLQEIPIKRQLYSKGKVIIEDNVWIGEGVTILPSVTIGNNCIIAANAVVTKSFPPNCIIGGNPARIIKEIINPERTNSIYE